jgi:hypothetical protein
MNARHPVKIDRREASDANSSEIYRLGDWRVIVCAAGIQWILQVRTRAGNPVAARWEGRHFTRSRETMLRLWLGLTGDEGETLLALLPERFRRT